VVNLDLNACTAWNLRYPTSGWGGFVDIVKVTCPFSRPPALDKFGGIPKTPGTPTRRGAPSLDVNKAGWGLTPALSLFVGLATKGTGCQRVIDDPAERGSHA